MELSQEIKKSEDYDKLITSLLDLREIQSNLAELLYAQDHKFDRVEENVYQSQQKIENGLEELQEAKSLNFSYKQVLLGGLVGGLIGGPLGSWVGLKYGYLAAGTGSLLGGIGGYSLQ